LEADAFTEKVVKEDALRRSRVEADIAAESAAEKRARLEQ